MPYDQKRNRDLSEKMGHSTKMSLEKLNLFQGDSKNEHNSKLQLENSYEKEKSGKRQVHTKGENRNLIDELALAQNSFNNSGERSTPCSQQSKNRKKPKFKPSERNNLHLIQSSGIKSHHNYEGGSETVQMFDSFKIQNEKYETLRSYKDSENAQSSDLVQQLLNYQTVNKKLLGEISFPSTQKQKLQNPLEFSENNNTLMNQKPPLHGSKVNSSTPQHTSNLHSETQINVNFPDIIKDQQNPQSSCGFEQGLRRFGNRYGSSSVGSGQQLLQDDKQKSMTHLPELQDYQKHIQFQMQKRIMQCAQNEKLLSLKLQSLQDRSQEIVEQQQQNNNYTKFCRSQASERIYEDNENQVSSFFIKDEDFTNNNQIQSINRKKESNKKGNKKKRRQLQIQ